MSWFRGYLGTIAMATLLAMLTWVWLYSESTAPPRALDFDFQPRIVGIELARADYEGIDKQTSRIRIIVTGPRNVVDTLRANIPCAPTIRAEQLGQERGVYPVPLTREDFSVAPVVQIVSIPDVKLHYVRYVERSVGLVLPITSEPAPAGFRVTDIRPTPAEIRVRLPADQVDLLGTKVNVQKVPLRGQTASFGTPGYLQLPSPDMRQLDDLRLEVVVEPDLVPWTVKGVPWNLSGPRKLLERLAFKNDTPIDVLVEGPQQDVKELKPQDLHVYVRVDHLTENDLKTSPITVGEQYFGCEIVNPKFRGVVRVKTIMSEVPQPENRQVEIVVLPEK